MEEVEKGNGCRGAGPAGTMSDGFQIREEKGTALVPYSLIHSFFCWGRRLSKQRRGSCPCKPTSVSLSKRQNNGRSPS
jgi:hypothetical protein